MTSITMRYLFFLCFFPLVLSAQIELFEEDSIFYLETPTDTFYEQEETEAEEFYVRPPYVAPPLEPVPLREMKKDQWGDATGDLDYSKDLTKTPKERKKRAPNEPSSDFDWSGIPESVGIFLQIMAILFALGMLAYGIYWMMQAPRNRVIARDGTEITLANLDEYIHETDLEKFLREALNASNWPLAVRLYFLQIIKQLSEREAIVWSKEKTNRDYLREMRGHVSGAQFREATREYERVWYGNQPVSAEEFAQLEPALKDLLGSVSTTDSGKP
ncbi:MAG: DUF4129 domain-containing protein [Saprospiraceae bacterium]|nr:DUF4129 domain-containing protein [Saprospiraceae bacterium]